MRLDQLFETAKPKKVPYDKMSQEEQIAAVTTDPKKLRFIKNQSDKVQMAAYDATMAIKRAPLHDFLTNVINPCEAVQLKVAKNSPYMMGFIQHPTEKAQQTVLDNDITNYVYLKNASQNIMLQAVKKVGGIALYDMIHKEIPSNTLINTALTDPEFITKYPTQYTVLVKKIFINNTVLMNKWLRYAENMRNMS